MCMNDVLINKVATIQRCLKRIVEVYSAAKAQFDTDFTSQDSIILNLQRACEASIDIANILNKQRQTGVPQTSRDSFALLSQAGLIPAELSERLQKMVGLCNVAVHDYQTLNLDIVRHVVEQRLVDFEAFIEAIKRL